MLSHSMSNKQGQLTQIGWFSKLADFWYKCNIACVYEAWQDVWANSEWFWRYALLNLAYSRGWPAPNNAHSNVFWCQ